MTVAFTEPTMGEHDHRSQPAMAGEFYSEIQSFNTTITGGWVQMLGAFTQTSYVVFRDC